MNKKHPKRRGYYYGDGKVEFEKPLPSVTTILGVLNKKALVYWAARTSAKIALNDPSKSLDDVLSDFDSIKKDATTRGKGVHQCYRNFIQHGDYTYPEKLSPYIKGLLKFIDDHKPEHIFKDRIVVSHKYGYAGEVDSLDKINGKLWLIDIKTGGTYPEHALQLSAYEQALREEGITIDNKGILLLPGDDTYQLITKNGTIEPFLALKRVWEWTQEVEK